MRHGRIGFWYRFAVTVIKPLLLVFTKRDWRGAENIPRDGGVILAVNHISWADPLTLAHFVYDTGRLPRFLAKSEVFKAPFVGRVVTGAKQIPVLRHTADAAQALGAAIDAVNRGECVVIYPEGTVTRDPDLWPMGAKTGIARLALTTGAPVIPVAQWGAQEIMAYKEKRVHLLPRKTVRMLAGPAVDLSAYAGEPLTTEVLRAATEAIMARVREQVGVLREQTPPSEVHPMHRPSGDSGDRRSA